MLALRLGAQSALVAAVLLGCFGITDQHPAKLPIVIAAGVLGWVYFIKKQ